MSFNIIYGKGRNPKEALIYSKVNEIGYGTKPRFLKKTNVKYLEYRNTNTLETLLHLSYFGKCNRDPSSSEENSRRSLIDYYGVKEFNAIMDIYSNIDSEYTICFKIGTSNGYNLYKFLY